MMLKKTAMLCVPVFIAALCCASAWGDDRAEIDRLGKTLVSQLKQYQQAAGPFRKTAGSQAIDTLFKIARLRAINNEPFLADDALSQAKRIATDSVPAMLGDIKKQFIGLLMESMITDNRRLMLQ